MTDLYANLGVSRDATIDQIEAAYRELARRWYPANNPSDKREKATEKFRQISQAYEILTTPHLRETYDKSGYSYKLKTSDPELIYTRVFGPNYGIDDPGSPYGRDVKKPKIKDPDVSTVFHCTLEQLFNGVTKVFEITKNIFSDDGDVEQEKKRILIKVKPGWRTGTKITFKEEGDERPGRIPADLIFVLKDLPHAYYQREGNDLIHNAKITLRQALMGLKLNLPFLDGSIKQVAIPNVISPDYIHTVKGYGMPMKTGGFGNLIIKFQIQFPKSLGPDKKSAIGDVFDDRIEWVD